MKFVTLLNENGNNSIINEFDNLTEAYEAYNTLNVNDLEEGEEYELLKCDENNEALDWEDLELNSIKQPLGTWVTKSK